MSIIFYINAVVWNFQLIEES